MYDWCRIQNDVTGPKADNLRYACTSIVEQGEHRPIAAASPCRNVWSGNYGVHFRSRQKAKYRLVMPFHGNGQIALDDAESTQIMMSRIFEERADGGQACIPAPDTVTSVFFQVIQEIEQQGRVHVIER